MQYLRGVVVTSEARDFRCCRTNQLLTLVFEVASGLRGPIWGSICAFPAERITSEYRKKFKAVTLLKDSCIVVD